MEATAVFATLAPRRGRARPRSGRWSRCRSRSTASTRSASGAPAGDGGYLDRLFGAFRESAGAARPRRRRPRRSSAPSPAAAKARRTPTRPSTATAPRSRPGPRAPGAPPGYRWWEVAAGASSSVAAHALIAAAADPRTSAAEAAPIDAAYFPPIGALTVLLDDLIDRDEDAAAGAHNYLAYYRDGEEAADRLDLIARLGRARLAELRHRHRHAAILAGVAGFYLSAAEAETPYARPARERLLRSTGPAVRPIVAFMRLRRSGSPPAPEARERKQPGGAGSASGP